MLRYRIEVLNRKAQTVGAYGVDSAGIEWQSTGPYWASVEWAKGKSAMNVGALDAYEVVMVRMRWNCVVNMRSRIVFEGQTYQIIPETFHADKASNKIQFNAQLIISS